ncbi:uncharacterized protein LOC135467743 [Liolophura sinensis]|uniref:uncharacterized protein LOC135467743 n=1 Tax=Liolophura sinensis TaxID=3198878 RepID=UPI003158E87C
MAEEETDTNIPVEEEFKDPLGVTAEEQGEDKVRVQIVIPGLAVKTKFLKSFSKQPSNALIEPPEFTEWGFSVIVRMKDKGKRVQPNYRARIKKLPGPIDPDQCYHEVICSGSVFLLKYILDFAQ